MFLTFLYLADHQDVLSPDLFRHGSRSSFSLSDLLKLPILLLLRLYLSEE